MRSRSTPLLNSGIDTWYWYTCIWCILRLAGYEVIDYPTSSSDEEVDLPPRPKCFDLPPLKPLDTEDMTSGWVLCGSGGSAEGAMFSPGSSFSVCASSDAAGPVTPNADTAGEESRPSAERSFPKREEAQSTQPCIRYVDPDCLRLLQEAIMSVNIDNASELHASSQPDYASELDTSSQPDYASKLDTSSQADYASELDASSQPDYAKDLAALSLPGTVTACLLFVCRSEPHRS